MKMVSSPPPTLYVIIPVYNREDYIEQCVSSVLRQTYPNIVVVCVDDGSIDQSPTILKKIAKDHTNVVVLTKTNGGPSSARNAGLDYIDGKEGYFTFVDSDDWISDDFCEYYMKALLEKQCAAVKTGRYNSCVIELTRNEALCALARHEIWYGPVCLFANIQSIRGLRFDKTLAIGEDLLWNVSLINRINGLVIVPDFGLEP